jgi:hypothetical protein
MNSSPQSQLLAQIAQIRLMERGKLSTYSFPERSAASGRYYKLQCWEKGKNCTRYIPPEQVPLLREALEGQAQFQELTQQDAQLVIAQTREQLTSVLKKKDLAPEIFLAQDQEIQPLITRFQGQDPRGTAVQELEVLVRPALFKPAHALGGSLLPAAADRVDAADQPKLGEQRKGREKRQVQGWFGVSELERDYDHHAGKQAGHYPADAARGLEGGSTPALARWMGLEGADDSSDQKAENHWLETGGIPVSARQIQRVVPRVGVAAQAWQEREAQPGGSAVPLLSISGEATGLPMRKEELVGRLGKQEDGGAKTRRAYLGCVFTQHKRDEEGPPVRDDESTPSVSSFAPLDEFGPCLRPEALRRGLALALQVVLLIDGATGLANMGRLCFASAIQIVDFSHALEHAGQVLAAWLGSKDHPDDKIRLGGWARQLRADKVEKLIAQARQECWGKSQADAVEKELGYFVNHVDRMQ